MAKVLRARNIRATPGRLEILSCFRGGKRLSARAIVGKLMRGKRPPGVATVYRALKELTGAGLLRRIPAGSGGALFAAAEDAGIPQLVCSRCGKVEEVRDPNIARYNAALMKNRGVDAQAGALLMYADCNRQECEK